MPQTRRISAYRALPAGYHASVSAFLETEPLQVVAILHAKQDLKDILRVRLGQP